MTTMCENCGVYVPEVKPWGHRSLLVCGHCWVLLVGYQNGSPVGRILTMPARRGGDGVHRV